MKIGVITSPVPGHLNPLSSIGRELKRRGHEIFVFSLLDTQDKIEKEGLQFVAIGEDEFPRGAWNKNWGPMAKGAGAKVLFKTVLLHTRLSRMMCEEIPKKARALGIEAFLIDQVQFQGRAIADHLGLPFVSVSCTLVLNKDKNFALPPPFAPWNQGGGALKVLRNRIAWKAFDLFALPILAEGNKFARKVGLKNYPTTEATYSTLAQIVPMPKNLDFDVELQSSHVHHTGPFIDFDRPAIDFPYEKLDSSRPLVYASCGTLQNDLPQVYAAIAEACAELPVQLVLAMGDWQGTKKLPQFAGDPIVMNYAPQLELLKRASICITHCGPNTVYEALHFGVPLVGFPIANDQPAVAARMKRAKTGPVFSLAEVSKWRMKSALEEVLRDPQYKQTALRFQREIQEAGGVSRAADLCEAAFQK